MVKPKTEMVGHSYNDCCITFLPHIEFQLLIANCFAILESYVAFDWAVYTFRKQYACGMAHALSNAYLKLTRFLSLI